MKKIFHFSLPIVLIILFLGISKKKYIATKDNISLNNNYPEKVEIETQLQEILKIKK